MNIIEIHDGWPTLTVRQMTILILVSEGIIYTTRIASHMGMFPSVVSRNVHSLVGLELLTRTEERDDRNCQKFHLRLTPVAKKLVKDLP